MPQSYKIILLAQHKDSGASHEDWSVVRFRSLTVARAVANAVARKINRRYEDILVEVLSVEPCADLTMYDVKRKYEAKVAEIRREARTIA